MYRTRDNKRPIEQIFVAKAGVNSAHASGEALTDSSTGMVDLVNGEIKVLSYGGFGTVASNKTIGAADTVTAAPDIYIVQGTADSGVTNPTSTYPLTPRPYEKSEPIVGNNKIIYTYRAAKRPTYDTVIVGDTVGATGAINVLDEQVYATKIAFFGKTFDEAYSGTHPNSITPSYTSKDYTTLGYTTAQATDDIIQNLAYATNKNSQTLAFTKGFQPKKPIIAFAIDTTGTQGIDPTTVAAGAFVPVVNTNLGLRGITFTKEIVESFKNSTIPAGATIIPIDLSLAGNVASATALVSPTGGNYSAGYKGTLTFTGQPSNTETVVVGSKTYTFQSTLTNVDGNVKIGATAAASISNLVNAINLGAGAGTAYATAMTAQTEGIRAQEGPGLTLVARGSAGSASTETVTNASWGNTTLQAVNYVSGKADAIIFMALDREQVDEDRVKQTKTRIDVGLLDGFNYNTVKNSKIQTVSEGEGLGKQWAAYYKDTAGQRKYSAYRGFEEMRIDYPVPVDTTLYYDAAILEHYHADLIGTDAIVKPFKAIILIPCDSTTLVPDSGTLALVESIVLPWVNSTDGPIVSILG